MKNCPVQLGRSAKPPWWLRAGAALVFVAAWFALSGSARADFKVYVFDDGVLARTFSATTGTSVSTGEFNTPDFHVGDIGIGIVATSNSPGNQIAAKTTDLTFLATNTTGSAHTLTVAVSDINFINPSSAGLRLMGAMTVNWGSHTGENSNPADSLQYQGFVNLDNKQFASNVDPTTIGQIGSAPNTVSTTKLSLNSTGGGTTGAANSPDVVFSHPPGAYSISGVLTINLIGGDALEATGDSNVFPTPAPGGWVVWGSCVPALALVGWVRSRRRLAV
ncbi:MAG: hypothetical protein ACJ8F7_23065 [Gemmataceae bacterium]